MITREKREWYLEYQINVNRAGLLGDVSSLLGMMGINIERLTVSISPFVPLLLNQIAKKRLNVLRHC